MIDARRGEGSREGTEMERGHGLVSHDRGTRGGDPLGDLGAGVGEQALADQDVI